VTSPLLYVFAVGAGMLAILFLSTAVLTYRHARTRSRRADDLRGYVAASRASRSAHAVRARAMHVTIGDLIRDELLFDAAAEGVASRGSASAGPDPAA
jgi:hypothetical protein